MIENLSSCNSVTRSLDEVQIQKLSGKLSNGLYWNRLKCRPVDNLTLKNTCQIGGSVR